MKADTKADKSFLLSIWNWEPVWSNFRERERERERERKRDYCINALFLNDRIKTTGSRGCSLIIKIMWASI